MLRILFVLLLSLPVAADDRQAIHALIDGFHSAAANSDFDDYFSRFSDRAFFLGTDASERWSVEEFKAYAKPAFDAGRGWRWHGRYP